MRCCPDLYARLRVIGLSDHRPAIVTRQNIEVVDFDWSPDSASLAIAFTSVPGFEDLTVRLAVVRRSDGELLKSLTDSVFVFIPNVRWSSDGATLLFFESSPRKGSYWMSLIDPRGGQVRPFLKEYPGTSWACKWAPDSKQLIAGAIVGARAKLLRIDVRTGEVSTLADVLNLLPDFTASADGRILAYVNEKADSPCPCGKRA